MDDMYLQGGTSEECLATEMKTIKLFTMLGFIVHPSKSNYIPSQTIKKLGFILNSKDMTECPTQEKQDSTIDFCSSILLRKTNSIRNVAQLLGKMVACFPGALLRATFLP